MFNKSFNLTAFVKDIPSLALRGTIWFSLVGSVNAQIIGSADYMAQALIKDGLQPDDLRGLNAREIKALFSGPDGDTESLEQSRVLYKLHSEWRAQLLRSSVMSQKKKPGDKDRGSIKGSLEFMTGPNQNVRTNPDGVKQLGAIGVETTPEQLEASRQRRLTRARDFAAQRAGRAGMIEYIIDQLFASNSTAYDDEDDEMYSRLDEQVKENLCNKVKVCLEKALIKCVDNTLDGYTGDTVLGVGDHIIAKKLLAQLPDLVYSTAASKAIAKAKAPRKPKVAKSTVKRAPKPVVASTVTTEVNGIKVTTAA